MKDDEDSLHSISILAACMKLSEWCGRTMVTTKTKRVELFAFSEATHTHTHTAQSSRSQQFVQLMMAALTFHHRCRRRRGKHSLAAAARSRACLVDQTIIAVRGETASSDHHLGPPQESWRGPVWAGRCQPAGRSADRSASHAPQGLSTGHFTRLLSSAPNAAKSSFATHICRRHVVQSTGDGRNGKYLGSVDETTIYHDCGSLQLTSKYRSVSDTRRADIVSSQQSSLVMMLVVTSSTPSFDDWQRPSCHVHLVSRRSATHTKCSCLHRV